MKPPFELFLALRYLQPKRTFVSIISVIAVAGVTVGVAVLIVVISVMSGFSREFREKMLSFYSPLYLVNPGGMIRQPEAVYEVLAQTRDVEAYAPYVNGPVLIEARGRVHTPMIRGIDFQREGRVNRLGEFVIEGAKDPGDDGVVVGVELAVQMGLTVGDHITVYAPRNFASLIPSSNRNKEFFLPSELVVAGIFQSGVYQFDSTFMLTSLATAQRYYNLGAGVHGIAVKTRDLDRVDEVARELNSRLMPPVRARTWMDLDRPRFNAIVQERILMFIILTMSIIVSGFCIMSTLITVTVQKTREIGLLKALGARDWQIMAIFTSQGLCIGAFGSLIGAGAGLLLLQFRNPLKDFLGHTFGIEVFSRKVYEFYEIPAIINPVEIAMICLMATGICTLAGLIPSLWASRLGPLEALRRE
ncbi:MAG: ABC transporter permease [Verrucomicrobiae bacterium]|nr:ABC transporter permease [Verrucomicrobiae bacterium]